MYPSFSSKQDRTDKRKALYDKYTRELENDELKRQAYARTLWSSDQEKNTLKLNSNRINNAGDIYQMMANVSTTQASNNNNNNAGDIYQMMSNATTQASNNIPSRDTQENEDFGWNSATDTTQTNEDIGREDDSMSDIDDTGYFQSMQPSQKMQESSKRWLVKLYEENPILGTERYNIIRLNSQLPDRNYILGKNAMIFHKDGKKARQDNIENIDWERTSYYVEELMKVNETRLGELNDMSKEDKDSPYINYLKRKPKTQKRSVIKRVSGVSNDTENDQEQAYYDLLDLYNQNIDDFNRLGVNLIDKNQNMISGFTLKLNKTGDRLIITKNSSDRNDHNPSIEKHVSWLYTLQYIFQRLAGVRGTNTRTPRGWQQQADDKVETGISTQVNIQENSKQLIDEVLKRLPWIDTLDIKPVQNYKDGPRLSDSYKFGDNFDIYTIKGNRTVSGKAKENLLKQINWNLTLNQVIEAISHYNDFFNEYLSESDVKRDQPSEYERMQKLRSDISSVLTDIGIKRADYKPDMGYTVIDFLKRSRSSPSKPVKNDPNIDYGTTYGAITRRGKGVSSKIVGRGLRGAGRVGLRGYSSTSKNLRSIQGSGSASDLKYKQLGSKFIRITDLRLDPPKLKLVYPNRTQVGRIIEISKPLAKCIEYLAFEQDVNQQMYNKLKINDKQAIHDLLRLCHLDTTFLNPITDPLETLQAEYDKLRSQVMLGNDNPDNIRELKTLSLDLYNKNLLSEDQMREILSL